MTREEAKSLFTQCADVDKAPEALSTLSSGVEELFTQNETLTNSVSEAEKTIAELRDTNMKLFLQVTNNVEEEEEEEEKTPEEEMAELIDFILKE